MYAMSNDQSFNQTLTNDIVSFEQEGPEFSDIQIDSHIKLLKFWAQLFKANDVVS